MSRNIKASIMKKEKKQQEALKTNKLRLKLKDLNRLLTFEISRDLLHKILNFPKPLYILNFLELLQSI